MQQSASNVLNGLKGHFSSSTILHNSLQPQYKKALEYLTEYYLLRHICFISDRVLEIAHSISNITDLHINVFACILGSMENFLKNVFVHCYVLKVEEKWGKEEGRGKLKGGMKASFVTILSL